MVDNKLYARAKRTNNLQQGIKKIAVIGLGYVGLPLAVEFSKKYSTVGFDINQSRVEELNLGIDKTLEVSQKKLQVVLQKNRQENTKKGLVITTDKAELGACNIYIITVPTPTDKNHRPVLIPLYKASETVGAFLKSGDIVIYESTVYPGVTEEECVPVLERTSGLTFNKDFYCGYSPERINPGDKQRTITKILKITSGSTPKVAEIVDQLYKSIINAGTFKAASIKVAEAAKVIENSQRDLNIAFVNELSKIFNLLKIDTSEVLAAANTKWNFLPFKPGLVGGHCIGVDPYYLTQKAQEVGYYPELILAGRRLNDKMGQYISGEVVKLMIQRDIKVKGGRILILGITFKENCPDIRNTKVIDIYRAFGEVGLQVDLLDPLAHADEVFREYGISIFHKTEEIVEQYDAVVLTVAHASFLELDIFKYMKSKSVLYDVKSFLPKEMIDGRL